MPDIKKIKEEIISCTLEDAESIEAFRIKYIGSKGLIKSLFKEMKDLEVLEIKNNPFEDFDSILHFKKLKSLQLDNKSILKNPKDD